MINADKFEQVFGIYATELWAKPEKEFLEWLNSEAQEVKDISIPSAEPERLTDDDFETIRIHLNAYKEKLCNQQRWEEAKEYQRIIDRFMAFASAEPRKKGKWIKIPEFCGDDVSGFIDNHFSCSECKKEAEINSWGFYILSDFCPNCGARMVSE